MIMEPITLTGSFDPRTSARGVCPVCGHEHCMAVGYATQCAKRLLGRLLKEKRIDFDTPAAEANPGFSTDYLFGKARGQMFGVLVCRDKTGKTGFLKAFSGQYNGEWLCGGWVPPLVDVQALGNMSFGVERYIKRLGRRIDDLSAGSAERAGLVGKRKAVSQALMKDIHALYRIPNFRGELKPLPEIVTEGSGIPTGTGDCCAPKLLGYAALHSLTPLGVAEFYFGKPNKSGTKRHGAMYTSCKNKCGRILGYMLCGQGTQCPTFQKD